MKSRGFWFYCFWFLSLLFIFALADGWTNPFPFPCFIAVLGKDFSFQVVSSRYEVKRATGFRNLLGARESGSPFFGSLRIRVTFYAHSKGQRCKVSIFHGDLPSCRKQRQREVSFPPGAAPSLPLFSRFSSQTNALGRSNKFSFMRSLLTLRLLGFSMVNSGGFTSTSTSSALRVHM